MASANSCFHFVLNGERVRVDGVAPQVTLLDYVRSRGLTGAKEGCAEGECGACAVLFLRNSLAGPVYQSVNSCLVPVPMAAGQEVYTAEGLAGAGDLIEAQRAMAERGGSQCGYCTPGFVVSMVAEQYRRADRAADVHALGGNLCRCTGYRPIRDALLSLGPPEGPLRRRLDGVSPAVLPFRYEQAGQRFSRPGSLAECFKILADDPEAQFVAGNTDLGVATNLRGRRFRHLISLEGVGELRGFADGADLVEIGAGLTLTEIEERWVEAPPVFREWLPLFASVLIRNRATLGGNLATASPIGDAAPMLMALDAEVAITGAGGERVVPLHEFFRGYRKTSLGPGELLRAVRIPKRFPAHARFFKFAKRSMDDISTVAAGIALSVDRTGKVWKARIAFGGVAAVPVRVAAAERALEGAGGVNRVRSILAETLLPLSDHRGSAAYRLAMAQNAIEKFLYEMREGAAA